MWCTCLDLSAVYQVLRDEMLIFAKERRMYLYFKEPAAPVFVTEYVVM
jgi:hypothetical protein